MKVSSTIEEQWKKLFEYYKIPSTIKCKGATEEQIVKAEKELGVKFPKDFADSFRVCDERFLIHSEKKWGWFGENEHYSLNYTYYDFYNLVEVNKEIRIYEEGWNKNWIVFYDYETWFQAILNTKTEEVYLKSSEDIEYVVWANSYKEWLEMAVNEVLNNGEIKLEVIEKKLGIIS